jgi:hypothetical protein
MKRAGSHSLFVCLFNTHARRGEQGRAAHLLFLGGVTQCLGRTTCAEGVSDVGESMTQGVARRTLVVVLVPVRARMGMVMVSILAGEGGRDDGGIHSGHGWSGGSMYGGWSHVGDRRSLTKLRRRGRELDDCCNRLRSGRLRCIGR